MKIDQSEYQCGFIKELSPNMSALLISEAKAEARQNIKQLYLATLNTQKALDVAGPSYHSAQQIVIFVRFVKSKFYHNERPVLQYTCSWMHFILRRKYISIICSHS